MPQKFLHLNCFFTCGMIASNLLTFCSIVFAVGGCTRAPRTSASLVRTMRSLIAFAWSQLLDLTISVYGPESDATDATPYQKLAVRRICCRGATVSDLGGACAVSYTVPSTIALAMSRAVLSRLGSAANACLYAHTDESRWPFRSNVVPSASQNPGDLGKCRVAARAKSSRFVVSEICCAA